MTFKALCMLLTAGGALACGRPPCVVDRDCGQFSVCGADHQCREDKEALHHAEASLSEQDPGAAGSPNGAGGAQDAGPPADSDPSGGKPLWLAAAFGAAGAFAGVPTLTFFQTSDGCNMVQLTATTPHAEVSLYLDTNTNLRVIPAGSPVNMAALGGVSLMAFQRAQNATDWISTGGDNAVSVTVSTPAPGTRRFVVTGSLPDDKGARTPATMHFDITSATPAAF